MSRAVRVGVLILLGIAALLLQTEAASPARAGGAQAQSLQVPPIPAEASVAVDASTTAFLALDFLDINCAPRPPCVASLPDVEAGLQAARAAGVPVVYSVVGNGNIVPEVAPQPGDAQIASLGADKFFGTNLDEMLKARGVTTVVITGTSSNGAVLYTSFAAAERGYTVVIATDGISAGSDFATQFTEWQLLNGPGTSNAQNDPLKPRSVTLSRTDLITYH